MKLKNLNIAIIVISVAFVASAFAQDEPFVEGPLLFEELEMPDVEPQLLATISLGDAGWSDPTVGDWNPATLTGTLRKSLRGPIEIVSDGITLDGAGHTITGPGSGIGVSLHQRTGVTIKNIDVKGWSQGIRLWYSDENTLAGNSASDNGVGLWLIQSDDNTLTGNTSSNNGRGIYLSASDYNTLTGNTAVNNSYSGIQFVYCNGDNSDPISDNSMSGNRLNFILHGDRYSHYDHDIETSNTVDGRPVYYVKGESNRVYDSSTNAGYFCAVNCTNITVRDLTLTNNYAGVYLWNTHDSLVENVVVSGHNYGILLSHCGHNILTGNIASDNSGGMGIHLYDSHENTVKCNTTSNNGVGIYLQGSNSNEVYNNNLIENNDQVRFYDSSCCNKFDLGSPIGGNYWSNWCPPVNPDANRDGFVDAPYSFFNRKDNLPWAVQDGWLKSEAEVRIELLATEVLALNLKGLAGKVNDAVKVLTDANPDNDSAAVNKLNDFISQVNNNADKISDAGGNPAVLIAEAEAIIALLEAA